MRRLMPRYNEVGPFCFNLEFDNSLNLGVWSLKFGRIAIARPVASLEALAYLPHAPSKAPPPR